MAVRYANEKTIRKIASQVNVKEREEAFDRREQQKLAALQQQRKESGFEPQVHVVPFPASLKSDNANRVFVLGAEGHGEITGFFIGHVPEGKSGRRETGGCEVPGPWAFAFAGPLSITCDGRGTSYDVQKAKEAGLVIEARIGDLLEIDGVRFSIEWHDTFGYPRKSYIKLIRILK